MEIFKFICDKQASFIIRGKSNMLYKEISHFVYLTSIKISRSKVPVHELNKLNADVIRHALKLSKKVFTIKKRENAELLFKTSSRNLIFCKDELSTLEKFPLDQKFENSL